MLIMKVVRLAPELHVGLDTLLL